MISHRYQGNKKTNNYEKAIRFLFGQLPIYQRDGSASYKIDLSKTQALDDWFNHPHRSYRSIHIAGTNGKGSVAHMLASILMKSGLKVGLYTSPHLKDFRERIRINGKPVTKDFVVSFLENNRKYFSEIKPSFFELTVFMALAYFQKKQIDVAVVETGLGGRLDSTNVIRPDLSIITNIGHDHSEYLGNSLVEIATEKAGIIKTGVPVVIGESQPQVADVFMKIASKRESEIVFADQHFEIEYALETLDQKQKIKIKNLQDDSGFEMVTDLLGQYEQKNLVTTLQAVECLRNSGYSISYKQVANGMERVASLTGLMGRWQIIQQNPLIVCDTGHNLEGLKEVIKQIKNIPFKKPHIVLGMVKEKEHTALLELFPKGAKYYFTKANIPRALHEHELEKQARSIGLYGLTYGNVKQAYDAAISSAGKDDMIFVGGSTFVVAEIL